ncbi:MAG: DUF456 domain-containing protein [bacterium]|jgi:hypothetical protein|nr:DUF456 domain-containing protein [Betaproteobacteria bacterium]
MLDDPFRSEGTFNVEMTWVWAISTVMILTGLVGLVAPLLPGTLLIFAGVAFAAWAEDFTRISGITVGVLAFLTLLAWVLEYVAGLLGAKAAGASRAALVGAAIGTVLGVLSGFWGLLVFPLIGAFAGEFYARGNAAGAGRVSVATWLGILVGTIAKVVIGFMMVGIFIGALVF